MNHPEHICRFNDALQTCECYDSGYKDGDREAVECKIYGVSVDVIGDNINKPKEIAICITMGKNYRTIRYVPTVQLIPDSFGFRYMGTGAPEGEFELHVQQNEMIKDALEKMREYPKKMYELNNGKLPWVVFGGKADEEEKFAIYKLGFEDAIKILSSLDFNPK